MSQIGVVGAGAFGTALACAFANGGHKVALFGRKADQIHEMNSTGYNRKYLPKVKLPNGVTATNELGDLAGSLVVLMVVPAQQLRSFATEHDLSKLESPLALCAKGVEKGTGLLQTEVLNERAPTVASCVITGPGFATEIAMGKPTALTLASEDQRLGEKLQSNLSSSTLRLYLSDDPRGAQLGGALKNVMAIACGIVVGANLGESARAALMTRGFAEMSRLAQALGAQRATLIGLSGLGDLALTCTSEQSRNFAFGQALGASKNFAKNTTVEGVASARASCELASRHNIEMPIANVVAQVLCGELTIPQALKTLMSRPLKQEI